MIATQLSQPHDRQRHKHMLNTCHTREDACKYTHDMHICGTIHTGPERPVSADTIAADLARLLAGFAFAGKKDAEFGASTIKKSVPHAASASLLQP